MLFDLIEIDYFVGLFAALFIVMLSLNFFVYPKKFFMNKKVFKDPDTMIKDDRSADGRVMIFQVNDELSQKYINKAVVMTKGINCYLRAILATKVERIVYEVTMFDEKEEGFEPFKTIIVTQSEVFNNELDLIRLSERTKAIQIKVLNVDDVKINEYSIAKKQITSYSFVASLTMLPAALMTIGFIGLSSYDNASSFMIYWQKNYELTYSIAALVVPILAYFACVGIMWAFTKITFCPKIKYKQQKGVKKNG